MSTISFTASPLFAQEPDTPPAPLQAVRPGSTAGNAFAAYRGDSASRAKRSGPSEITEKISEVPYKMEDFGDHIRRQLDSVVDKINSMDASMIEITGYEHFFAELGGRRAKAVAQYFAGQGIDRGLMTLKKRGGDSSDARNGVVKIEIAGTPRRQASVDALQTSCDTCRTV